MSVSSEPLMGLPRYIDEASAHSLSGSLREAWLHTMGKSPGDLQMDLELCRRWFDPVAQGQRLRRELAELEEVPDDLANPGEPFTLTIASRKWLVTPEGRCALDLLEALPHSQSGWVIEPVRVSYYYHILADLYRSWSRHRIDSVIALLEGTNKPLQIPAAGVVLALLINGSIGKDHAMIRFALDGPRELVDKAFFASVNAFADVLVPKRRGDRNSRLISGWMLYEVRRRVGDGLVIENSNSSKDGQVWIRPGKVQNIVDIIARDLARGHRPKVTSERLAEAFDALVDELRRQLPRLAGFGLSHEQPTETRRLRFQLLEGLSNYLTSQP
jgi:hypothetical protein